MDGKEADVGKWNKQAGKVHRLTRERDYTIEDVALLSQLKLLMNLENLNPGLDKELKLSNLLRTGQLQRR